MARIPRLYRVRGTRPDGTTSTHHYQTPAAAAEREVRMVESGKFATVVVTPSHPVTYPHPAGDPDPLGIPDSVMTEGAVQDLAARLGVKREAIQAVTFAPEELVVQYQPDPTGKREPKLWRISVDPLQ